MTLIKWNNRRVPAFTDWFDDFFTGNSYHPIQRTYSETAPAVNIQENNTEFIVDVAAPGYQKNDFNVEVDRNQLVISAKSEISNDETNDHYTKREFSSSSFQRSFTLPETVKEDKIAANYENGILKLSIPKREEAVIQPKREIKIS